MLDLILTRLNRWLPQPSDIVMPHAWTNEDGSWHHSSFELARGLDVIELRDAAPPVFADTLPAFQYAGA